MFLHHTLRNIFPSKSTTHFFVLTHQSRNTAIDDPTNSLPLKGTLSLAKSKGSNSRFCFSFFYFVFLCRWCLSSGGDFSRRIEHFCKALQAPERCDPRINPVTHVMVLYILSTRYPSCDGFTLFIHLMAANRTGYTLFV